MNREVAESYLDSDGPLLIKQSWELQKRRREKRSLALYNPFWAWLERQGKKRRKEKAETKTDPNRVFARVLLPRSDTLSSFQEMGRKWKKVGRRRGRGGYM